jgi:hypothetical protein
LFESHEFQEDHTSHNQRQFVEVTGVRHQYKTNASCTQAHQRPVSPGLIKFLSELGNSFSSAFCHQRPQIQKSNENLKARLRLLVFIGLNK